MTLLTVLALWTVVSLPAGLGLGQWLRVAAARARRADASPIAPSRDERAEWFV